MGFLVEMVKPFKNNATKMARAINDGKAQVLAHGLNFVSGQKRRSQGRCARLRCGTPVFLTMKNSPPLIFVAGQVKMGAQVLEEP